MATVADATAITVPGRSAAAVRAGRLPLRRGLRRNAAGYPFLLPWLIGFFGLTLGPTLASLYSPSPTTTC